jgi:hypothetical protein
VADDTTQTGSDLIATDHVSNLNGAAITPSASTPKVQRVKLMYGDDGTARDVSALYPLPIDNPDLITSSTIAASGASVTTVTTGGNGVVGLQLSGTFVATLSFEATSDGTNWFAVNGVASVTGAQVSTATAPGQWRINSGGYSSVRVRASAYTSGTVAVGMVATSASTMTTLAEPALLSEQRASPLAVSVTAAAAAAATLTLPAAGAGLFHYITSLTIDLYSTAARTGVATPIVVTSTNLPGTLNWTFSSAGAIGAIDRFVVNLTTPLKSSVANTATTVVGPIVTGGLWRINATYFTAT